MRLKRQTRRRDIKPLGVAERLKDAPDTRYAYGRTGAKRPAPGDTYVVDGTEHTFDGTCHDDCENVL